MSSLVTVETQAGEPLQSGDRTLIPFARSLHIRFPNKSGGFNWIWPVSLLVQSEGSQEQVLPIPNITRRVQLWLIGLCLGMLLISVLVSRKRSVR